MAIARAMKRLGARWYLFGAQAVALHGAARATQDIDVTVLADFETKRLLAALKREGINPDFEDAAFIAQTRVVPAKHTASVKVLANRPRDVADAARLLQLHRGAVNVGEVTDLLRQLELALAEVARLEALLTA